jgi:lysophospholipase L1-like esterase
MRRILLALLALLMLPGDSFANVTVPSRTLQQLGGRQVWLPICSRRGVNGSAAWFDNTNTAVMDQVACIAPSWGTVTALRLVYAAFDMPQQGEVDRPVTATGTASIYVPSANNVTEYQNGTGANGATTINLSATAAGANAVSVGQLVSSSGGGVAANTYVTNVTNSFVSGAGNAPSGTVVSLSTGTTAATAAGQPFTFSGAFVPVKFGGKRQFTIEPGHDVITSDPAGVELAPGTEFFVRTSASFSGTGMQLMDYPGTGSRLTGEFDSRSTTLNDQTMTPVALGNTGGGYWCPVAVLGLVTLPAGAMPPGAVLVLGDSIAAGTGDTADPVTGLQGYIQRALWQAHVPFITAARGSTTAAALAGHGDGQYALSVDTGITDVLVEDGRNDISSFNLPASTVEGSVTQIAQRYAQAGKRVWCFTVPPTTQSNDGWTTLGNQGWTIATPTLTAAASAGATSVTVSQMNGIAVGETVSGTGIPAGTTVTSANWSTLAVGLSNATTASIASGAKLNFGSQNPGDSASETQRQQYNLSLRTSGAALGCSGVIDVDQVFADPGGSGKWRVDLGAASADGVHPSAALHQAVINAGLLNGAMFQP